MGTFQLHSLYVSLCRRPLTAESGCISPVLQLTVVRIRMQWRRLMLHFLQRKRNGCQVRRNSISIAILLWSDKRNTKKSRFLLLCRLPNPYRRGVGDDAHIVPRADVGIRPYKLQLRATRGIIAAKYRRLPRLLRSLAMTRKTRTEL